MVSVGRYSPAPVSDPLIGNLVAMVTVDRPKVLSNQQRPFQS